MDTDVIVVGGGLAGLVSAAQLAEAGADVTLLEREDETGGRVDTRTVDGFTLDHGFQVLFTSYPAVSRELDVDALDLQPFAPGATICRPGSRAVLSDPLRDPRAVLESALNHEVPFADKLRTLALRYDLSKRDEGTFFSGPDVSIREYLDAWGFSRAYIEHFVEPFYGGITLDRSLSTSKQVFEYTFRAMSNGSIAVPTDGMAAIAGQLETRAREAGVTVRTGETVERVEVAAESDGLFGLRARGPETGARVTLADDSTIDASTVVVATTPPEARRLTDCSSIPTTGVPSTTGWYALPAGTSFETGRRILLNAASDSPNAVVPMSEVTPEYGTDDRPLLCATFLGDAPLDRDDDALRRDVQGALTDWYPERGFEGLETVAVDRIPFAQFAQPPGVYENLPGTDDPDGPVVLAGAYTEWSAIQGALEGGRRAAAAASAYLG